jgi:hypothetical protein
VVSIGPNAHLADIPKAQTGAGVDLNADGYDDLVLLVAGACLELFQARPPG